MISISLNNIFPEYFVPNNPENSQIWNKENTFQKGDKILVVAPSGSGKSTLATAMLGVHTEYSGHIFYDNTPIKSLNIEEVVKSRINGINLLFQDVRLIKDLTLYENIMLRVFKSNREKYGSTLHDYATRLGIDHLLSKKASNCSYGERQRTAIIRSLINPTDFLVFDECFSHLDVKNRRTAFDLIDQVAERQDKAVIFFELNDLPFEHQYKTLHL